MAFERDFFDMMPQTVTYYPYSSISTDGYASRTYGTSKSVKARIEAHRRIVKDIQGRDVVSTIRIITAPYSTAGTSDTVTTSPLDKITLPTGFIVSGSSAPPIITAYPVQDDIGHHHNEVLV